MPTPRKVIAVCCCLRKGAEPFFSYPGTTGSVVGDRILAAFERSGLSKPVRRIVGVEEQMRGELIHGVPDVLARIDLIVESDVATTITDLKTARSHWSAGQVGPASRNSAATISSGVRT